MGIVSFPYNKPMPEKVTCVLCGRSIHIDDATMGPLSARSSSSLMCNGHLWEDRKFVDELADFEASERRRSLGVNGHNLIPDEVRHVRTVC